MKFGSICSGIEAASVAWEPLGLKAAWLSEIEPFPSAVLAHHWPDVVNVGDMYNVRLLLQAGMIEKPDILVGGTPCQAFSVAGLRKGLDDERGQLTLEFIRIADELEDNAVILWENVPGVLSSKDNAFGCLLAGLAGESAPLRPAGRKWTNAGCVFGPKRTVAWRILDAQYFGLAQRRRRVFVVASAPGGADPCKILFESEGVRRDTPPSREARASVAALTANGVGTCGADDNQGQAGHLIAEPFDMLAFGKYGPGLSASTLKARDHKDATDLVCFTSKDNGRDASMNISPTLRAGASNTSHPNGGTPPAVAGPEALTAGVRRLTPVECARLQGFPDNYTLIPWRGKPADECPDGPQYKAYGNSMATYVMRWLGKRIVDNKVK